MQDLVITYLNAKRFSNSYSLEPITKMQAEQCLLLKA